MVSLWGLFEIWGTGQHPAAFFRVVEWKVKQCCPGLEDETYEETISTEFPSRGSVWGTEAGVGTGNIYAG